MAKVQVNNVVVLDNPSPFYNPFQFEITFECIEDLSEGESRGAFFRLLPGRRQPLRASSRLKLCKGLGGESVSLCRGFAGRAGAAWRRRAGSAGLPPPRGLGRGASAREKGKPQVAGKLLGRWEQPCCRRRRRRGERLVGRIRERRA